MAQDKTRLPEGTDRIVPGASASTSGEAALIQPTGSTGTGGSNRTGDTSGSTGTGGTGGTSGTSGTTSEKLMEKVRTGKDKVAGQAAGKTRDFVGQGLGRSSEALSNVGRLVGDTAQGIDERLGSEYGDYARKAADAIDNAARKLATKNPDELIDDTRDFVRKSPGIALAGAAIVGFALARLVKAGFDQDDSNDTDTTTGRTR